MVYPFPLQFGNGAVAEDQKRHRSKEIEEPETGVPLEGNLAVLGEDEEQQAKEEKERPQSKEEGRNQDDCDPLFRLPPFLLFEQGGGFGGGLFRFFCFDRIGRRIEGLGHRSFGALFPEIRCAIRADDHVEVDVPFAIRTELLPLF